MRQKLLAELLINDQFALALVVQLWAILKTGTILLGFAC
jgi:hypothetical protein